FNVLQNVGFRTACLFFCNQARKLSIVCFIRALGGYGTTPPLAMSIRESLAEERIWTSMP
ncbi:hypothetical protein ACHAXM_005807, partial [Skeletonema potamos]